MNDPEILRQIKGRNCHRKQTLSAGKTHNIMCDIYSFHVISSVVLFCYNAHSTQKCQNRRHPALIHAKQTRDAMSKLRNTQNTA